MSKGKESQNQDQPQDSSSKRKSLSELYNELPEEIKRKVHVGLRGAIYVDFDPILELYDTISVYMDEVAAQMIYNSIKNYRDNGRIARTDHGQVSAAIKKSKQDIFAGLPAEKHDTVRKAWDYHEKICLAVRYKHSEQALTASGGNIRFVENP